MDEARASAVIPPECAGDHAIRAYDFLHPERLSRRQLRMLETVHREAAGVMASRLTVGESRADVQLDGIAQLGAQEFVAGLPRPTVILLLAIAPLSASGVLRMDTGLGFEIINALMGGRRELVAADRALTEVEHAVLRGPTEALLECLSQAWQRLGTVQFSVASVSDAHFALLGQPQDPVLVVRFRVTVGAAAGGLAIALPLLALERSDLLNPERMESSALPPGAGAAGAAAAISDLPVECTAEWPEVWISLADLRDLAVGDVVMLGPAADTAVELVVRNDRRFPARLISRGRQLAAVVLPEDSKEGVR